MSSEPIAMVTEDGKEILLVGREEISAWMRRVHQRMMDKIVSLPCTECGGRGRERLGNGKTRTCMTCFGLGSFT